MSISLSLSLSVSMEKQPHKQTKKLTGFALIEFFSVLQISHGIEACYTAAFFALYNTQSILSLSLRKIDNNNLCKNTICLSTLNPAPCTLSVPQLANLNPARFFTRCAAKRNFNLICIFSNTHTRMQN